MGTTQASRGDEWLCGYAAALTCMLRLHRQPAQVVAALLGDGLTIPILEIAKVDPDDLTLIKKAIAGASPSDRIWLGLES